jgi:hypothetical protein
MKKHLSIIILSIVAFLLLLAVGFLLFVKDPWQGRFYNLQADYNRLITKNTKPAEEASSSFAMGVDENDPYSSIDSPASKIILEKVKNVPAEWGSALSVQKFEGREDVYIVDYSNRVDIIFQTGVDSIYYLKYVEENLCSAYPIQGPGDYYGPDEKCSSSEDGFYNLTSGKIVKLNNSLINAIVTDRYLDDVSFENAGGSKQSIFSPSGKFFYYNYGGYEGCSAELLDTETGKTIVDDINCLETVIDLSSDENIIATRSTYGGMNSPFTSFAVTDKNGFKTDLLYLIYPPSNTPEGSDALYDFDVIKDVKISSLDNNSISFEVLKNDVIDAGKFEYSFTAKKLTKLPD